MIVVQTFLLHIALTNRAPAELAPGPFADVKEPALGFRKRPYDFWQWKLSRPYWQFIGYLTVTLCALQVFLGEFQFYISTIGYLALAVEAILPIPQILSNHRNKSCKGFRLSVLINWLIGDLLKMSFFFLSKSTIPWSFKLCGIFQAACDAYLGFQYTRFGNGPIA